MSQLGKSQEMCAFCMLVVQTGYDKLAASERAQVAAHLKVSHGIKPYRVSP